MNFSIFLCFIFFMNIWQFATATPTHAEGIFFEVTFLDYVHEYARVYANVDIFEEGDYKGFLCGSPDCQDKYDLFAGLSQHFKKYQMPRILLTDVEKMFQQISNEGLKFCLTKLEEGSEDTDSGKTLCFIRQKGKGQSGSNYQFFHDQTPTGNPMPDDLSHSEEFFSAEEDFPADSREDNDPVTAVVTLNKTYKKAKANVEALKAENTEAVNAKGKMAKMIEALHSVISAKLGGTQYSKVQAKRLLLLLHDGQHNQIVYDTKKAFGEAALKAVLAFDNKYALQANQYLTNSFNTK